MSENGFIVRNLPNGWPRVTTDANNEVSFHFSGVRLDVDASDGSFVIHEEYTRNQSGYSRMQIVKTGLIDKKGKYTFNELSRWTKEKKSNSDTPFIREDAFDELHYFKNEIEYALKQYKVRVYV